MLKKAANPEEVFSETDVTEDLKKIEVPVWILHGGGDQLAYLPNTGAVTATLFRDSTFNVYTGAPHGHISTAKQPVNEDLLAFIRYAK